MPVEDYFVLLHLSTTADEHQVCVSKESAEILEIAWSIEARSKLERQQEDKVTERSADVAATLSSSILVRPINTPVTELCTTTTGVTAQDVSDAGNLADAVKALSSAIDTHILAQQSTFALIVLDAADLQAQLVREAKEKNVTLPDYLLYPRFYSIQDENRSWQGRQYDSQAVRPSTCAGICSSLSIPPPVTTKGASQPDQALSNGTTRVYRASDNVMMLSRIVTKLLSEADTTSGLFTMPTDSSADLRVFLKEESKVLHLSGLAPDTTQSELESWFTQHGGRPIAFWTLRTPDQHKPTGTGFAVFATHQEARDSLGMNGRLLVDKSVRVSPSSLSVLDRATEILMPFPPSKNRPRPGDWTCPSCGFSNFQRRTACFRCSYPASAALDPVQTQGQGYYGMHSIPSMSGYPPLSSQGPHSTLVSSRMPGAMGSAGLGANGGGHVPFRAGDWSCQTCAYHNFARNSVCLKCSMPRQQHQQQHMHHHHSQHQLLRQQQQQQQQQDMNGMSGSGYGGYDGRYRMDALTNDMARQML